jgi:hypothetical protein
MRPMLRKDGTTGTGCCSAPPSSIDQEINSTREELQRLRIAASARP